jgi:hypothetical protein
MNIRIHSLAARVARLVFVAGLLACGSAKADWVVSTEPEAVRPAPGNFQVQAQNPPAFAWSRYPSSTPPPYYTVEVWQNGAVVYTYTATRNWYLPSRAFPIGHYSWRVRPSTVAQWSNFREFDITSASTVFEVPDNSVLRSNVVNKPRQIARELPSNFLRTSQWTSAMYTALNPALQALMTEVKYKNINTVKDSDWPIQTSGTTTYITTAEATDIRNRVNATGRQLEAAALLFRLTLNRTYFDEAVRRADQLASLSPTGPTAYKYQDQATRQICLSLIKATDMLYYDVDTTRRQNYWNIINRRMADVYADLAASGGRLDEYPFDSHGGTNLGFLALISALSLGNIQAAGQWFDFSVRAYMNAIYAWSGPEGGFANGTAYGQYTADYALQLWQPLMQATSVNLFDKPWSRGFMQYFIHFLPPGSPAHLFGDENENAPDFRLIKSYAERFNSPYAAWYVRNIPGAEDTLTLLQAPYPLPYTLSTPAVPPNAALYPSIGWVAMHSNIADPLRTSVYFKSSPYGAYNHSHGDQNSLIVISGGRKLLAESGYLDYYGSTLANTWYRQTKAHSAVTFDNGVGEIVTGNTATLSYNGKINAFSTTPALDYAEGDASQAYGAAVTSAIRRVWYLRSQDAVVVQDKIAGPAAHAWEWNLHAAVASITNAGNNNLQITNVDRTLCIRPLLSNSLLPMTYQTRTGPAPKPGTYESHGAFVTPASTSGQFLLLLDVGCKHPAVSFTETTTSRTFTIGTQQVTVPK